MKVYGIKNCDTVKKCLSFLEFNNVDYDFIDLKKSDLNEDDIKSWESVLGWNTLINTKSTTWRSLSQDLKDNAQNEFVSIITANKSIMKRPLIVYDNGDITVGFNTDIQEKIING
ncbi:MAG: Spx/MgsR family RNA polymerase-binding regulatory protein [Alphaproteobacteria bacterium]